MAGPAETSDGNDFLAFAAVAVDATVERLPQVDRSAMTMVLLLHRVAGSIVYDLESSVHRPAGWSWSAFRVLFALWVSGPMESHRLAELTGMSRAAVSSLAKTLAAAGLLSRAQDPNDRRVVVLALTDEGARSLESVFLAHNAREAEWAGLLSPEDRRTLTELLTRLARAAQAQPWIRHRT